MTAFGVVPPAQVFAESGLAFLRGMIEGRHPAPPIMQALPFRLVEVAEGRAVFEAEPGPGLYNPIGTVHGGFALTVLDSALGCAVHTTLATGEGYTSLETKGVFHRPILATSGLLRAEARVISRGRRVAAAEAFLRDATGRLMASGTSTCLLVVASEGA